MNTVVDEKYSIPLKSVEKEFELDPIWVPDNMDDYIVERADISRPGLPLAGYYENFEETRLQLIGYMEHSYLENLSSEDRIKTLDKFFAHKMPAVIVTSGLSIDVNAHEVTVDGEIVKLTATEYGIVEYLMKNLGRILSTDQIYEAVWGEPPIAGDKTVTVHIRRIREKIEINPKEPKYLKVVWGIGYKIEKF
jgi:serine kinase of HPr protein (carbohydrate metabolism regulator)